MKKTKKTIKLFIVLMFITNSSIFAQSDGYASCPNENSFMESDNLDDLKLITDTIYPYGTMLFDMSLADQYNGIDDILTLLGVEDGTTFELDGIYESQFDDGLKTLRFQQFYNGVIVDGGGYSMKIYTHGGGGTGPCDVPSIISPDIISVDIDVNPDISEGELGDILKEEEDLLEEIDFTYSLSISHNLLDNCDNILTWKLSYANEGRKIAWIDAQSGDVLKKIEEEDGIHAPVDNYCEYNCFGYQGIGYVDLDDTKENGFYKLKNNLVETYYFFGTFAFGEHRYPKDCTNSIWLGDEFKPKTENEEWSLNEGKGNTYQSHYVATNTLPFMEEYLKTDYGKLHIATGEFEESTISFFPEDGNSISSPHLSIGYINDGWEHSYALYDIMAHELGHIFLYDFLTSHIAGPKSLHEGICDVIGVYVSAKTQNTSINWSLGHDDSFIENRTNRNLKYPNYNNYNQVKTFGVRAGHLRGEPLGHLFYLLSNGNTNSQIIGLGADKAFNIFIESVRTCGMQDDYPQYRERMVSYVAMKYGNCSVEMKSVKNAWNRIGVGENYTNCKVSFSGPESVCEEDELAKFCVDPNYPGHYRWYILGPKCTQYESEYGMNNSNTQEGGSCLSLIDFPKYPYYPQYIKIKLYYISTSTGETSTAERTLRINDCNHDDPTCEEYYDSQGLINSDDNIDNKKSDKISSIKIIDLYGNLLYEGTNLNHNISFDKHHGILIRLNYDSSGKLINIKKVLNTGRFK